MRLSRTSAWCLTWLLCCNVALARWEKAPFTPLDTSGPKSSGGLSAVLLLADNPDDVLRTWATPGATVPVRTVDAIQRGIPIVAFVFFTGCLPDANGMCDASVDFTILRPDGSEYDRFGDRELWKGRPAPPDGMMRLAAEYVGVVIEPSDPLGEYTFLVSIHDRIAGASFELQQTFTATETSR